MKKIISTFLVIVMCIMSMSVSVAALPGRPEPPEKPKGTGQAPVCFYISRWGTQYDTEGDIATRDVSYFSNIVYKNNLKKNMGITESIVIGANVTEDDLLSYLTNSPKDSNIFKDLKNAYEKEGALLYTNSGKPVEWENLNEENYGIMWYVLKIEDDGWHVDGYVYELETNETLDIVLPDEIEDYEEMLEELQKEQENENQEENNEEAENENQEENNEEVENENQEENNQEENDNPVIEEDDKTDTPVTEEEKEPEVIAPEVGSTPLPEEETVTQVDTSIKLRNVRSAYIFGYEPLITVTTDEETGETYTTAKIKMAMDESVSREEVCAMLVRTLDQVGYTSGKNFPMTNSVAPYAGEWFERGLLYLCSVGGLETENKIGIAPVTRGEVAKLVSCALELNLSEETLFTDIEETAFKGYIEKVYAYGYMQGVGDNRFCPDEIMTRAEFCSLFNNILSRNEFGLTALDENGEEFEITAEDYYFVDMNENHWAYEICLKATSAYDENGYVDIDSRNANIRNIIDRHDAQKEF